MNKGKHQSDIILKRDVFKQARRRSGLTQQRLAEAINVEVSTVGKWESGTRVPYPEHQALLCKILDVSYEELFAVSHDPERLVEDEALAASEKSDENLLESVGPLQSVSNVISEPDTEPSSSTLEEVAPPSFVPPMRPLSKRGNENRLRMLKRVKARWVTGVLDSQLFASAPLITLHLREQPDAVENPWGTTVQEAKLPARDLPPGTTIIQMYDDADGELLILGEPGAGKTTVLLELASLLLERAALDESHPIPVVFNLSAWSQKQLPLEHWLLDELNTKYRIPSKLAQQWIDKDQLLLLLDGLDEVEEAHRTACIEVINSYRKERGMVPMALCCRYESYFKQPGRLSLGNAVVLQKLAEHQVDMYVLSAGENLSAMREVLKTDGLLKEMVSNPLMLSIVCYTYHGISVQEALVAETPAELRRAVFERYVDRVLKRRGPATRYHPQETKQWLHWLACQLKKHNQTELYLERLQPDWLSDAHVTQRYQQMVTRLVFCLECFIVAMMFSLVRGGQASDGKTFGVSIGLFGLLGAPDGNQVLGWMAPGLGGGLEGGGSLAVIIALVVIFATLLTGMSIPRLSWYALRKALNSAVRNGIVVAALVGTVSVLLFTQSGGMEFGLYRGSSAGLYAGLLTALMSGLLTALRFGQPGSAPVKRSLLSWSRVIDAGLYFCSAALGFGGVYTIMAGGMHGKVVTYTCISAAFYAIVFGFGGGTHLLTIGQEIRPAESVNWSWSQVRRDIQSILHKALLLVLVIILVVAMVIGCSSSLYYGVSYGLQYGMVFGSIAGLIAGSTAILAGVLYSGWSSTRLEKRQLFYPNEGIQRSARNALLTVVLVGPVAALAAGVSCAIGFGLLGQLDGWLILGVGFAIVLGVIVVVNFALNQGGLACIEHYVLRWYLWRSGVMPLNYVSFLDYAAERILLRKVGGGYIFLHRLLLEYFASLPDQAEHQEK